MINWKRVRPNKLYKVYWLDPITYTDEKLFKPLAKRTNYGYIKLRENLVYVISADTKDDENDDYDYTVVPKHLIYKIEDA
jgi:hypothetical protein